jgi:transcriptional regulator with XRE-family HTH domain
MNMNPFTAIVKFLETLFPGVKTTSTPPLRDDGVWSLDLDRGEISLAVEWDPTTGFGISTVCPETYGEGPDEYYREATSALARLITLLELKQQTAPQTPLLLSQLRERRKYTQVALATRLDMRQSTLSAIEHREDIQLSTLRNYVTALHGRLELLAAFDDTCYVIDTKAARRRSKMMMSSAVKPWFARASRDEAESERELAGKGGLHYAIPI